MPRDNPSIVLNTHGKRQLKIIIIHDEYDDADDNGQSMLMMML